VAQYSVDIVAKALGGSEVDRLANSFKNVETAAAKAQQGMGGAANNIRAFGAASSGAAGAVGGLGAAITAALGPLLSVAAALALVKKGLDVAFERGAAEQKLKNFTDSTGEYNAALAVASQAAQRFGLSQTEASTALADVYGRLKGLGFGLKETSEIYMGFNAIAKASGTTAEDASGAFLQLSQALGSGKLQGDELRAILERMPQLAQAIASSMGVSAAEIRKMGEEGKITSDVIYKALSGAATASGDFSNKLNDQQKAMASLKQVADQLLNSIGKVFAPFVIAGAEALAAVGQKLADWWGYLGNVIFPAVMKALEPLRAALANAFADIDFSVIIDVVQNILIKGMQAAIGYVANLAKVLAIVVNWFKELSNNSIIQGLVGAMGAIVEKLGLSGSKVKEWKAEQGKVTEEAGKSLENYSSMPEKVEDAKAKAKELKKAQEAITESIKAAVTAADQFGQTMTQAVDNTLSMTQARLEAEQAVNGVLLQQAERQLDAAVTQEERVKAAQAVYQLTVRQAELELQATRATIAAELEKARIAVESARMKEREVYAVVQLAIAQQTVTAAHFEALNAQRQAVGYAEQQLRVAKVVAAEQNRAAEATYRGKVAVADAAYQQNVVAKNTQAAASAAGQFASNMQAGAQAAQAAAGAAQSAAGAMEQASSGNAVQGVMAQFGAAANNPLFAQEWYDASQAFNLKNRGKGGKMSEYWDMVRRFIEKAEAYNRGKAAERNASAQEDWDKYTKGRTSEAMSRYSPQGGGGGGAPQVNLTYSGNIMRAPEGDYVKASDVPNIVSEAVNKTMNQLRSSPNARAGVGMR
jgi:tape measure domain-containing protein